MQPGDAQSLRIQPPQKPPAPHQGASKSPSSLPNPSSILCQLHQWDFPKFHPQTRAGWEDAAPKQSLSPARGSAPHCRSCCGQGPAPNNSLRAAVSPPSRALNPPGLPWLQLAEQAGNSRKRGKASPNSRKKKFLKNWEKSP